jgi:hypothetical protein
VKISFSEVLCLRRTFYIEGEGARWPLSGRYEYENGAVGYYLNGKIHRLDGPAIIAADGREFWWINGHNICHDLRKWAKEREIDLTNLSDEDKSAIMLEWSHLS